MPSHWAFGHLSPKLWAIEGPESNWQFDSRPLKVENRYFPDLRMESAIRRWKDLDEGYNFGSDLVAIRSCSPELWAPKVPGLHPGEFRDNFGLQLGSPGNLCHLDVAPTGRRRVYYREHTLESGPWCVLWSQVRMACPNTQGCPRRWTNHVGGLFWCIFMLNLLNLLPSLIPRLPTWPSTPF